MTARIREKHDGALTGHMDVRVWLRLLSCSTIIEKWLRRRFIDQFDTTLPRFDVMATLERHHNGVTMGTLSQSLLVSKGNVTAVVRQLEGDGYVVSRPAAKDKRSSIVALTETGRAYFAELAQAHHGWIRAMFTGMSRSDHTALYRLLAILKTSIGDDTGGGGDRG